MEQGIAAERPFVIMDRAKMPLSGDAMFPFAMEDLLCKQVGKTGIPVLHFWRHERALIMGLRDRKLPCAEKAMAWLQDQGYQVIVRHSGGAAVPLDENVLNVSLILPKEAGATDFHQDFGEMVALLRNSLKPLGIDFEVGEVETSYCPGDYDLSIGGRKFCGIAQRRQLRAFVIQAFIIVGGIGRERGSLAREFYNLALGNLDFSEYSEENMKISAPNVDPDVMASLSESYGREVTTEKVAEAVKEYVRSTVGIAALVERDEQWNEIFFEDGSGLDWHAEADRLSEDLHRRYNRSL